MALKCSFCGRGPDDALTFFRPPDGSPAGRTIYICDRCIESCHRRLSAKREYPIEWAEKQQFREWLSESVTETLIRAIVDMKYREPLLEAFAERANLAAVNPGEPPEAGAVLLLPGPFLRKNGILPWRIEGDHLVVAFYNPLHFLDIYDEVARRAGMAIRPALLPRDELLEALERYVPREGDDSAAAAGGKESAERA